MDMELLKKNISYNLTSIRKERKLSQEKLIKEIGPLELNLRTYKDYEKGKTIPELDKLIILSNYYGCSIDYFIHGVSSTLDNSYIAFDIIKRIGILLKNGSLISLDSNEMYPYRYLFGGFDKEIEIFIKDLKSCSNRINYKMENNFPYFDASKEVDDLLKKYRDFKNDLSPSVGRMIKLNELIMKADEVNKK